MKFFIVILAMIGIESFANYVGHAMADELYFYHIVIHRTSLTEFPNDVIEIEPMQLKDGPGKIKYLKDITEDTNLTFTMILKKGDEVTFKIPDDQQVSFCDPRPLSEVLRGAITPMNEASCPIKMGDYIEVDDQYAVYFKNPRLLECGTFTGTAHVQSGTMDVLELEFTYTLDPEIDDCQDD